MTIHHDLWEELCSYSNLEMAFKKARKHKTLKSYVIAFETDLKNNLSLLRTELLLHSYQPKPLETLILRETKNRKISKSDFRDRVVHHALCNVIEPIFEKLFIYDSYANRIGKGTLKAIQRFEYFKQKVTKNFTGRGFVLKADVKHYFEEVDHSFLLNILKKKINDKRMLWLIKKILSNYSAKEGKGMPLGNLTSQFLANVYLHELDQYVKYILKAKYYIRYVDDFVILSRSRTDLEQYLQKISFFLKSTLALELHPTKSRIIPLHCGVDFLGLKIFLHHKLIKLKNVKKIYRKFECLYQDCKQGKIAYDEVYDFIEGWIACAKNADMFLLRQNIINMLEEQFPSEISAKEINRHLKEKVILHER